MSTCVRYSVAVYLGLLLAGSLITPSATSTDPAPTLSDSSQRNRYAHPQLWPKATKEPCRWDATATLPPWLTETGS